MERGREKHLMAERSNLWISIKYRWGKEIGLVNVLQRGKTFNRKTERQNCLSTISGPSDKWQMNDRQNHWVGVDPNATSFMVFTDAEGTEPRPTTFSPEILTLWTHDTCGEDRE
jgi:hypothetical protein